VTGPRPSSDGDIVALGTFFRWWTGELAALAPGWLRASPDRSTQTLRFDVGADAVEVQRQRNGQQRSLGRAPRRPAGGETLAGLVAGERPERSRVLVAVDRSLALHRTLELPAAAGENLREVLEFELERQTPFPPEEVYFGWRRIGHDGPGDGARADAGRLRVDLHVAPRALVDEALAALPGWDLEPEELRGRDPTPESGWVALRFRPRRLDRGRPARLNVALVAINLALVGAAMAIPLHQQRAELESLRDRVESLKSDARAAADLREQVTRFHDEVEFLVEAKAGTPSMVRVLDELSALLPDHTWLHRLEVRGDSVQLQGTSAAASALLPLLDESNVLRSVRFSSPVTQDPASGRERFHLSAEIETPAAGS